VRDLRLLEIQAMTTLAEFLDTRDFGPLRLALGRAQYLHYKWFQKKRYDRVVLENVCGTPIVVTPGVLNPRLMRTGEFFASELRQHVGEHCEVLDMGTGSGVCAVVAAKYARKVTAVDINPAALHCARVNVLMNKVDAQVDVLAGDLFATLDNRRFDVVLFNPPFLKGAPRDDADRAWRSTDVAERFAAELRGHLTPSGFALVLLSTFGGAPEFVGQFQRHGFDLTVVAAREYVNEKLILAKLT
jgi:release factor glutamine methyltransferase